MSLAKPLHEKTNFSSFFFHFPFFFFLYIYTHFYDRQKYWACRPCSDAHAMVAWASELLLGYTTDFDNTARHSFNSTALKTAKTPYLHRVG